MPHKSKEALAEYRARKYKEDPDWRKRQYQRYKERNLEKLRIREREARFKDVPSNKPEYKLWSAAKYRSSKNGREFSIQLSDITIPEICPVLGIPIRTFLSDHPEYNRDNSPSLDRIDNSKGYTKDNIEVISYRANSLKSNANIEELRKVISYIDTRTKSSKNASSPCLDHSG